MNFNISLLLACVERNAPSPFRNAFPLLYAVNVNNNYSNGNKPCLKGLQRPFGIIFHGISSFLIHFIPFDSMFADMTCVQGKHILASV